MDGHDCSLLGWKSISSPSRRTLEKAVSERSRECIGYGEMAGGEERGERGWGASTTGEKPARPVGVEANDAPKLYPAKPLRDARSGRGVLCPITAPITALGPFRLLTWLALIGSCCPILTTRAQSMAVLYVRTYCLYRTVLVCTVGREIRWPPCTLQYLPKGGGGPAAAKATTVATTTTGRSVAAAQQRQ